MAHFIKDIAGAFVLLLLFQTISFAQSNDQKKYASLELQQEATIQDTLRQFATQANSLWSQQESDLNFATDFLSIISRTAAETYYKQASVYYFWSLANADFSADKSAITREVYRTIPLLPDSSKKNWRQYVEEENPKIFEEIVQFWQLEDPYSSTLINERLIEHWKRINYAQANFNRANEEPYQTDERGEFYIRLGAPDRIINTTIQLSQVVDPVTGRIYSFELGSSINAQAEIWEYTFDDEKYVFLFGEKDGLGEFGLRRNATELTNRNQLRIELRGSGFEAPGRLRRFSEKVATLGIYSQLSLYSSFYDEVYQRLVDRLNATTRLNDVDRFLTSAFNVEGMTNIKFYKQLARVPKSETSQVLDSETLAVTTQIFRFLDENNESRFILSLEAQPDNNLKISTDSLFLSNKLFAYDKNRNLLTNIDDLKKVSKETINQSSLYQLNEEISKYDVYFSSEVIDTSRNGIVLPGKVNSETSSIISTSGKKKITFPEPLASTDEFSISDIIIGDEQQENFQLSIPITPSLDYKFEKDGTMMIYFEAYNIPENGYSFTYYFKKDRWLGGYKKVDRSQVTVVGDKVDKRDKQLFAIELKDFEPDDYKLILELSPLGNNSDEAKINREIDFKIVE